MTTRTIELPAPRELKMTLTQALKARKTIRSFTTEPISDADLSTLLWCTAGITRPDGKRTVPSCLDLRTVSVCVLRADGAWRWNASKNTLELLTPEDLRAASTMGQHAFVDTAPVTLVFVVEATPPHADGSAALGLSRCRHHGRSRVSGGHRTRSRRRCARFGCRSRARQTHEAAGHL